PCADALRTARVQHVPGEDGGLVQSTLAPELDRVADRAVEAARRAADEDVDALPAASAPLLEIAAEAHAAWPVRLFAS
ncbi:urease accessory protein UreF, partial [Streptomyces nigra]